MGSNRLVLAQGTYFLVLKPLYNALLMEWMAALENDQTTVLYKLFLTDCTPESRNGYLL